LRFLAETIMRKLIQIDRKKMKEHGYNGVPLRQILMLNLSSEEIVILLNFFSHKSDWTMGNNGITEKNFFKEKNQKRVNIMVKKLKDMNYMSEDSTTYIMNLDKIQEDFKKNSNEITKRGNIKRIEKANIRAKKIKVTGGIESTPHRGIESTPHRGIENTPNYINNNGVDFSPKGEKTHTNNKTKCFELVVGGYSASAASASQQPSQITPTVVGVSGNTNSDNTPKIKTQQTPNGINERSEIASKSTTKMIVEDCPNDLKFLIDNSENFASTYKNGIEIGHSWSKCDISKYTNTQIANAVIMKIKGTPLNIPSCTPENTYSLLYFMVRFAEKTDNSKLWQEFCKQCNNDQKIIEKIAPKE
jgi:hypothetical protein